MKIKRIKIENYKCFKDTGWIDLSDNFNVIVGQNNSGKTSLVETFRLHRCASKPHRSLAVKPALQDPTSYYHVTLDVSGAELSDYIKAHAAGGSYHIPIPIDSTAPEDWAMAFLARDSITCVLRFDGNGGVESAFPSHRLFTDTAGVGAASTARIVGSANKQQITFDGRAEGRNDSVPGLLRGICEVSIYVFNAERFGISHCPANDTLQLTPDCSNLPTALATLQTNHSLYERYNRHVTDIFPTIKRVVTSPYKQNEVEIRIWSVDADTTRTDLALPLSESGTGVGQILAILFVAMTREASTIVIDEPNSFLHPGAAKKLIQILKQYPHQYIVSTHAPDLIAAIDPEVIHHVSWKGGESIVTPVRATELKGLRGVLGDLGVSLTDVFGYDKIIWVEGPTEQECFPMVLRSRGKTLPLGTGFVAVKQVGDFEARRGNPQLIVDIYNQLAKTNPLVPTACVFSFDREQRKADEIKRLQEKLGKCVSFLPRATYENYLLSPEAISAVLLTAGVTVSAEDVAKWFEKRGCNLSDPQIVETCDGATLLHELFRDLSGKTLEYRKTTHSVALTEWLLANKPDHLQGLIEYVEELVAMIEKAGKST